MLGRGWDGCWGTEDISCAFGKAAGEGIAGNHINGHPRSFDGVLDVSAHVNLNRGRDFAPAPLKYRLTGVLVAGKGVPVDFPDQCLYPRHVLGALVDLLADLSKESGEIGP